MAEFTYPPGFSPAVKELLARILQPSPEKRASIDEIKASSWFLEGGYKEDEDEAADIGLSANSYDFEEAEELDVASTAAVNPNKEFNPKSMNAFELITMCGGLDLTPMFDKDAQRVKKFTRFHTQTAPSVALKRIVDVLAARQIEHKVLRSNFKIKINYVTGSGSVMCTVQLFTIAPGLLLVDWRRGQGDLMLYYKFYMELRAELADLITGAVTAPAQ